MSGLRVLLGLAEENGPLAVEVMERGARGGGCEVGARGCARHGRRFLHVDDGLPVEAGTVLYVCDPCSGRCMEDPALARRLAGVPT